MSVPQLEARPQISIKFSFPDGTELGQRPDVQFTKFDFCGMLNGGYTIKAELLDPEYNILRQMIRDGYLKRSRKEPVLVQFQLRQGQKLTATYPVKATRPQVAVLLSMAEHDTGPDAGLVSFTAIDPASWYLNTGDASGGCFKGRLSDVIQQVCNKYAAPITTTVTATTDSRQNRWWMMRQDPKTFLASLLEWSSAITPRRTNWIVAPDGMELDIREQADLNSKQRAYYRYHQDTMDTIVRAEIMADNALSISNAKLVTAGLSAISGQYLDAVTDQQQTRVFAKDATTGQKRIAYTSADESFSKPEDGQPPGEEISGWTQVPGIPELYSAGDLGKRYEQYIDGRPRGLYLGMTNALLRAKFTVAGHGEWSDCRGLGIDTFYVRWTGAKGEDGNNLYFLNGNWLVYGFHHRATRGYWFTDLYGARFDADAQAIKVGPGAR